jgi:hypothetical protein
MRKASLGAAVILAVSANVYAGYMDNIRARCEAYGATPGTRDYYECMHDLNLLREKQQARVRSLVSCTGTSDQKIAMQAGDMITRPWIAGTAGMPANQELASECG